MIPLVVKEYRTLSQCFPQYSQVWVLLTVESKTVLPHQSDVFPKLFWVLVNIQENLVEDGSEVHRLLYDWEIVRTVVSFGVDGLAEEDAIMYFLSGEVEKFGADDHEGFAPFSFNLIGLCKKGDTFFWWMMGNISVVVRILSTSKKAGS